MTISDLSIRRPVFATVLSLLLLIVGVMATLRLSLREYPDISQPVVSINVNYRGANASVVETRITQILENEVAGLEGVDKLTSQSRDERSQINVQFTANRDIDSAANDVRDRITRIMARLPDEADPPQIEKQESGSDPVMFVILTSSTRNGLELTDYAERYLVDRIGAVPGVASVFINGARRYSMRVWLDRGAMAARRIAISDIETALRNQNIELPAGRIESLQREFTLRTETSLRNESDFRNLVVGRGQDGYLVRLGDVAQVQLAAENQRGGSAVDGGPALMLPVSALSTANVLEVSAAIRKEMALIRETLPKDITFEVNIDNSMFIRESMRKVLVALGETGVIVLVVIFLFLGSLRATLIPAATIPVSILAAAIVMAALHYSINTLTLLGAVLAIGLVVDDAIVVLENIVRRIEHGEQPLLAAMNGSREISFAVVATTMVLVAVFLPISYLQGNVGKLFSEFGVSVAAAVVFSAVVALTLTPMMTSKLFANGIRRGRVAGAVDAMFKSVTVSYGSALRWALAHSRPVWLLSFAGLSATLVLSLLVAGWPWSGMRLARELAPQEDRGRVQVFVVAPEGSTVEYTQRQLAKVAEITRDEVVRGNATRVIQRTGSNNSQASVSTGQILLPMKEWGERPDTTAQIVQRLRQRTQDIPGARVVPQTPGGLGSNGKPLQIVLQGPEYRPLAQLAQKVMDEAGNNPGLANLEMNYEERQPQLQVSVDRDKAADLGVSLANVARALETMLGSRVVTTFQMGGDEYNVVLQARDDQRASVGDLDSIYVRSDRNGELVSLASVVSTREASAASELRRFNRMRSVTVTANLAAGYPLGEALDYVEKTVHDLQGDIPVQIDYDGESRELKRSSGGLMLTFAFAMLIVYLVLAAQFESFVHPLVILAAVPMALTGALFGLWLFGSSINIFSQIGAVMLIGIASKNGILIVEFANQLRDRGTEFVEATIEAATARLRPVLMTTLATAVGAAPLMVATGAGAESRQSIGATVFFGSVFAVALTLFVVPALYVKIARNTRSPQYLSRLIDRLRRTESSEQAGGPTPPRSGRLDQSVAATPYNQLEQEWQRLHAFSGALSLLRWDAAVMMPRGSADVRGEQLAAIETEQHAVLTSPKVSRLLERAQAGAAELDSWQQANLREMLRQRDHAIATPVSLISGLARATSVAEVRWAEARDKQDFSLFAPHLESVLQLVRDKAALLGQALNLAPYDALMDGYTPGIRSAEIDTVFRALSRRLPTLIREAIERQAGAPALPIAGKFSSGRQRALITEVMKAFGFPFDRGRLDESDHPFTEGVAGDMRVTTKLDAGNPFKGLLAALHETGHALYDLGVPRERRAQPVGKERGIALEESQSLLIEMIICRSRPFLAYLRPLLEKHFAVTGAEWEPGNLYRLLTQVRRSAIRVDADELTYPMHVVLRYGIERELMDGKLAVRDLPEAWNHGMQDRLEVTPANAAEGCLQDVHWAHGAFGYFPSYAIGAVIAAQLYESMRAATPDLDARIERGDFTAVRDWLVTHVHAEGARLPPQELVKHATGKPLAAAASLRYLEARYLEEAR